MCTSTATSLTKQKSFLYEKQKFHSWVTNWLGKNTNTSASNEIIADISQMTTVLQAMGFHLKTFEKCFNVEQQNNGGCDLEVEFVCKKSGMRSVLVKRALACTCPNDVKAAEGIFWTVSGTGSSSSLDTINEVKESCSSLLPNISDEKARLVKDVIFQLISIVNNESTLPSQDPQWEIDPATSPPTCTSSPIPEMYSELHQLTLDDSRKNRLQDVLQTIKEKADEAVGLLSGNNTTFTKSKGLPKRVPSIKTYTQRNSPTQAANIKSFSPGKILTPKSVGSKTITQSKVGSFRRKSVTPANAKSIGNLHNKESPKLQSIERKGMKLFVSPSILRSSAPNISTITKTPISNAAERNVLSKFGFQYKNFSSKKPN